jgi:aspartate racemase
MYTSGSTGRPKGVRIPHRAVLRLVIDNDFADFAADHVVLQLAPLAFDASTFEIWAALLHGARLAIVSAMHPSLDDIAQAITRHRVTSCWLTSGLFNLMVDHQLAAMTSLRQLLAGGDVLSVPHVRKAMKGLPDCRFINGYGPTENTTFSCCYTIPKDFSDSSVPIGKAIKHSEALILDDTLKPVADGEAGELFVGGDGLALGYLNRPELDAERFIPHPFDDRPEARLYRTGDRVRRRTDGNIEFHGRVDRQVKINGKRVELDEIEAVLHRSGLVADAAVTSFESGASQRKLAAYVTPAAGQALSIDVLREFLRRELPDYMVPGSLKILEKLPLSPTGKLDRARLPAPDADALTEQPKALPRNALEASLLAIWQRVLGRDGLGIDDNFFDAGGTSLQMMKVHAEILAARQQDAAGSGTRKISIIDLFTYPSISALAKWLSQPAAASAPSAAMSAQERARRQSEALARSRPQPRTPSR